MEGTDRRRIVATELIELRDALLERDRTLGMSTGSGRPHALTHCQLGWLHAVEF
jgi:hypothetical protein